MNTQTYKRMFTKEDSQEKNAFEDVLRIRTSTEYEPFACLFVTIFSQLVH